MSDTPRINFEEVPEPKLPSGKTWAEHEEEAALAAEGMDVYGSLDDADRSTSGPGWPD